MKATTLFTAFFMLFTFSGTLSGTSLQLGEQAPAPVARLSDGQKVDFGNLYKEGRVLLYFFPKSGTRGCTSQACNLRDNMDRLISANISVVGVSRDRQSAQQKFITKNNLPFRLVSDPSGKLGEIFGVPSFFTLYQRHAFLIEDGKIIWHKKSIRPDNTAGEVLAAIAN